MATNNKDFVVKNGLIVGDSTNLVNYATASPNNPFIGQLWISASEVGTSIDLSGYLPISSSSNFLSILNLENAQNILAGQIFG